MTYQQTVKQLTRDIRRLKELRGTHDQVMRTRMIEISFGKEKRDGRTPTERALEFFISYLEMGLHAAHVNAIDEE